MDYNNIYSSYISEDICQAYKSEFRNLALENGKEKLINITYSFNEHAFWFINFLPLQIESKLNGNDISNLFIGKNIDYNLIKSRTIVNSIFCISNISLIKSFLEQYDENCFWEAFGVEPKEAIFYQQALFNKDTTILINLKKKYLLSKLRRHIIKKGQLKKGYIIEEIVPLFISMVENTNGKLFINLTTSLCRMVSNKFPEVVNRFKDAPLPLDFSKIPTKKIIFKLIRHGLFSKELLYYQFLVAYNITNIEPTFNDLHHLLKNGEIDMEKFKLHIITDKFGYDIYNYYVDFCKRNGYNCCVSIENHEFVSFSLPQLSSRYKSYFPQFEEQKAKDETTKCFIKLFHELKKEKYIDEECKLDDFLWAFGLLNQYPYGFKKIAFHSKTPRGHIQGIAAFLQLLVQLGYSSDEIHQMQKEPSIINEIFDLNVTRKNKPGEGDKKDLHQIVLDSSLPIVEDVEG